MPLIGLGATQQVQAIAQAIAQAEGGLTTGTFPYRTNNPCDVFVGGTTKGYDSMDAGWNACYNQIGLMIGGQSKVYTPDESISDIAASWAPASAGNVPASWANTVASALGLSPSDSLQAVGSPASPNSSTGLPALDTGGFDLSSLLPAAPGISLTDESGNLTGLGLGGDCGCFGVGGLGGGRMNLRVVPCSLRKANDFVEVYHRHNIRLAMAANSQSLWRSARPSSGSLSSVIRSLPR